MKTTVEPVTVMFSIFSVFTTPAVAEVVAPYFIIAVGAFTGASWALGNIEKLTVKKALFYYFKIIVTAMLMTVFISHFVATVIETPDIKWLYAPIAFILGCVGDRWGEIIRVSLNKVLSTIQKGEQK